MQSPEVQFRLFGPVQLGAGGVELPLGPAKQLCVAAALLLEPGTVVPIEVLVDRVWDESPPRNAASAVATYVSRLRRLITPLVPARAAMIRHLGGGYRLDCAPELIDLHRARRHVQLSRGTDDETAVRHLSDALRGASGVPLGGVGGRWANQVREQLIREWLDILVQRLDAELRLGRYTEIVPELRNLAVAYPQAEHVSAALMRALCAAGRPAEALDHYARLRARLRDDLGSEPSPQLQHLFRSILTQEPELFADNTGDPSGVRIAAVSNLPRDTPHFVDRQDELTAISRLLDGAAAPAPVVAIDGMPGVGKTALAIHVAHALAGRYPDGQLLFDLHGHGDQSPLRPAAVLDMLLRTVGVAAELVPAGVDERVTMWRGITARHGMLIVLDNVLDAAQVQPLLPGAGDCLVLVTSRRRLVDLDAALTISLDGLGQRDAVRLFRRVSERPGEPEHHVSTLVTLCGHLPLAIRVAAARLRHRPAWTVEHLVARVIANADRLAELTSGTQSVPAAFDVSYSQLDEPQRRVFRVFGVHPTGTVDRFVAAALAGADGEDVGTVDAVLQALVDHNLVNEPVPGVYEQHDLIRRYARRLASVPERRRERAEAERSLVDYYLAVTVPAARLISPWADELSVPPVVLGDRAPPIHTPDDVFAWLKTHGPGIHGAVRLAADRGWDRPCWQLAACLRHFYYRRGLSQDLPALYVTALAAATRSGDAEGQAIIHRDISSVHWWTADYDAALRSIDDAIRLRRRIGGPAALARVLNNRGTILHFLSRYTEAVESYEQAQLLFEECGDGLGAAGVLNNLSVSLRHQGLSEAAVSALVRGLDIATGIADVHLMGMLTGNLGEALCRAGQVDDAIRHLDAAVRLRRESGSTPDTATSLNALANAYRAIGRLPEATARHREAIAMLRGAANRSAECGALNDLGHTLYATGDLRGALDSFQQAMTIARATQQPYEQARALAGIARVLEHHDPVAGEETRDQARDMFATLGVPFDEDAQLA